MTATVVAIIIVVVVLVLLAGPVRVLLRRRMLRHRFGPEYERLVQDAANRREAEQELALRQRRHAKLPIRPVSAELRERYTAQWFSVQECFVDTPVEAVREADRLVVALMADLGYPTDGYQQRVADLSVEHAHALDSYRAANDVSERAGDGTTTEDLRQAMINYRSLFEDLLGDRTGINAGKPA